MYRQCPRQRTKAALLFKIFKNVEMDPWTHTNRRKVLSRKPVSEGPLSASQARCLSGAVPSEQLACDQSRETELLLGGRWGFPGHSCDRRGSLADEKSWRSSRHQAPLRREGTEVKSRCPSEL